MDYSSGGFWRAAAPNSGGLGSGQGANIHINAVSWPKAGCVVGLITFNNFKSGFDGALIRFYYGLNKVLIRF